ncbi:hypothetical protein E2C01_068673 [Portunus trituberculatus]|uniref:Uncharacterized protein n=1 Tax=Portunus trituberculatus TaxID=210409 RepID=A0A5B7HX62_PORTR|nr:hypothetical protein [Portunus trituberculatus]
MIRGRKIHVRKSKSRKETQARYLSKLVITMSMAIRDGRGGDWKGGECLARRHVRQRQGRRAVKAVSHPAASPPSRLTPAQ